MALNNEIGQPTFIEVIQVDPSPITTTPLAETCRGTTEDCDTVIDFKVERDLIDPARASTVKQVACASNIPPSQYTPHFRTFETNELIQITFSSTVSTKDSIVFVNNDILALPPNLPACRLTGTDAILERIRKRIARCGEIHRARFLWDD